MISNDTGKPRPSSEAYKADDDSQHVERRTHDTYQKVMR